MHSSSDTGHHSLSDKFKSVFKVGHHGKKDHVDDIQPLGHGAHGKGSPVANKSVVTPSTTDSKVIPETGATEGHRSVGQAIKETFTAAPWSEHHDKTLEALTHAKVAHHKAYEAQQALKAASESKAKSDQAQRRLEELEREMEVHRKGIDGINTHSTEYDNARRAVDEHTKAHDHHSRLAREAEEALAAKEMEMKQLGPQREQHAKALAPLQSEHAGVLKMRGEAERRREALLKELAELDEHLGPLRTREAGLAKQVDEQNRLAVDHEKRMAALGEEARLLHTKAEESRRGLEPHAKNLKNAHALLATKESDYNKAQKAHETAKERLPLLEKEVEAAKREAKDAALTSDKHASAFEKLKMEAEKEDTVKANLWNEARKTGQIPEEEGASKQELHKLADRFHTVLNHPIDTTTLKGDGITDEIHQAAAKITGRGATADGATAPAHGTVAEGPRTPEKMGAEGVHNPQMTDPYAISKDTTTEPSGTGGPLPVPFNSSKATVAEPRAAPKTARMTTPPHTATAVPEE
ncbi:hypothetical protein COCOBI_09-2820 [Coccomyxa sp. Obi]|nr:hypothetical protein COCOBI_09-2820 [Coccomyxa sp. Obi]